MKIHIFNPENDMALADGSPGYTPPANIRAYRSSNWQLPEKWAAPGDIVWDGNTSLKQFFTPTCCPEIVPWGWSKAIVHQLQQAGVPRDAMPSDLWLQKLRTLSCRETTVVVQRQLGIDASVCRSMGEVEDRLCALGLSDTGTAKAILKSPWSSSGKGLMFTENNNWRGWTSRILKLQGSVVVERLLDKVQDFAMLFLLDGKGGAEYSGLSVFQTDEHGHYKGNIVESEENKQAILVAQTYRCSGNGTLTAENDIQDIRQWYISHLPALAPWYKGPVGVDMLVTSAGDICPCVEINWRMTMGLVALY